MKCKIGITSTIPVEIIYAAQDIPVDLNNLFISDGKPDEMILEAERLGLPRNCCTWVKGVYSAIRKSGIKQVIGVIQGDCMPMISMLETLRPEGVKFIPFAFSYDRNRHELRCEMQKLMDYFGVQWDDVNTAKQRLDAVRQLAFEIDHLTWRKNVITAEDNLFALVNCTDFMGNPEAFKEKLQQIIARRRKPYPAGYIRLGLLGVPGVFTDLYEYLEKHQVQVVYHEIARQFAMPEYSKDLLEQNICYTYPYSISGRLQDINEQIRLRKLDGCLHYVQSFCHHQIEDAGMRKNLPVPMLTLEGDKVGQLDGRTKTRLDAFIHVLKQKKRRTADVSRG